MEFEKLNAVSVKDQFIQQMEHAILSGQLKPGDELPTERELANDMGVSKTAVHDGMKELKRKGFLDVLTRRGTRVADYMNTGKIEVLDALLTYQSDPMDYKLVQNIADVRVLLEGDAARRIVTRGDPNNITALRQQEQHIFDVLDSDDETFARAVFDYDLTMIRLGGNTVSLLIFNSFADTTMPFWQRSIAIFGRDKHLDAISTTTDLLEEGDFEEALSRLETAMAEFKKRYKKRNSMTADSLLSCCFFL